MRFAERLRQLRDAKDLSEVRLAAASGVSFAAVHEYGLGRRLPSYAAVVKLARALGVDCTAFEDCEDVTGAEAQTPARKVRAGEKPKKKKGRGEK